MKRPSRRRAVCGLLVTSLVGVVFGCRKETPQAEVEDRGSPRPDEPEVILRGEFRSVGKTTTGRAEIVRVGETFQLRLTGVVTQGDAHTRVYLVGLDDAPSSRAVDEAAMKYDMAALSMPDQLVELPSRPDPALRCVVLWNSLYAVNLAVAPLRAP